MKKRSSFRLGIEVLESRVVPSVFNVDSYGAVGDGQTDDTVAIREAMSAAEAAGGGTIYFPAGTYLVSPQASDPVTDWQTIFQITGSNLTFEGAGAGQSIIDGLCIGDTNPVTHWRDTGESYFQISRFGLFNITTSSSTGPISNVAFEGLTMDGDAGYTGDSYVGGNPATGDGWDMSHKAILLNGSQPINNISVTDCTLCNWRGEIVYAGGNEIGNVNLTNDDIYGTNASAVSVSGNLVMTDVTIGGSSPGMDVYNGVEDFAITSTQGTTAVNCTFECSSNPADPHGNGIAYLGVPGSALNVQNCRFFNNEFGILFSEVGHNVTVSDSLFQNNVNATIDSVLGLYPQYPTGFGNFAFIDNTYDSTGVAFVSQFQTINGLFFSGNTLIDSTLISDGFPASSPVFVVENTTLGIGGFDGTYTGIVGLWSGTTRYGNHGNEVNDFTSETTTDITPMNDYTFLNYNITKGPQTATLDPSMIGMYPVGFSTTIFDGASTNWVLPVDPTWNDFASPIPVTATGVTVVVGEDGKFTLLSSSAPTLGFAAPTVSSGSADTLTFSVEDANGNPISGLPNTAFQFGLSGGTSAGTFGPVTETSTPGTYTTSFTGSTAGTASTLTVSVDGVALANQATVTVVPDPVSGSQSTVGVASGSVASGASDDITIAVVGSDGEPVSGLPSSAFQFSLSGGTSAGTFAAVTETSTPGTYTVAFTGTTAGTASTLTAIVDGVTLATPLTITVVPGDVSAYLSTISEANSTDVIGTTDTFTIQVQDADGNAITGLSSSAFQFSLIGGAGAGTFGTVTETTTPGTYTVPFTGTMATALTDDIVSTTIDGIPLNDQPSLAVSTLVSAAQSTVGVSSAVEVSGSTDTLTIAVQEVYGTPLSGLSSSAFQFSLSGGTSAGTFGTVTETATPGTYTTTFTATTAGTAATLTVSVQGVPLADQPSVTVVPGAVSLASGTDVAGTADAVTIVVRNSKGNLITGLSSSAFRLALSGGKGKSAGTFGPVTPTASPGVYTATFTGTTAGTASKLSVTVNGVTLASRPSVIVVPGAVSASQSPVNIALVKDVSGTADAVIITVKDAAGNPVIGLPGSAFQLALSGGTGAGTFGPVTAGLIPGNYRAAFTGTTAGAGDKFTVNINGATLASKSSVTVVPGAVSATQSSYSLASGTDVSGTADAVTMVVKDANRNPITGLSRITFRFILSGGKSAGTFGPVIATATPGVYTTAFTGTIAGPPSNFVVTAKGVSLSVDPTITVTPGAVNAVRSTIRSSSPSILIGKTDTLTIVVRDAAGNAISGLPTSAFQFVLSVGTGEGTFGTVTESSTAGTYTVTFTGTVAGSTSVLLATIDGIRLAEKLTIKVNSSV